MTMAAKELCLILCSALILTATAEANIMTVCMARCEAHLSTRLCNHACADMVARLEGPGVPLVIKSPSSDFDRPEDKNERKKREIRLLTGDKYWKWQWYADAKRTGRRHSFFRIGRNGKQVGNIDVVQPYENLKSSSHGDLNDQLGSTIENLAYQLAIMDQNDYEQTSDESVDRLKAISHVLPDIMEAPTLKRARQRSRFMRVGRDTSAVMALMDGQNELQKRRSRFLRVGKSDGSVPMDQRRNYVERKDNEDNGFTDESDGEHLGSFTGNGSVMSEKSKRRNRFLRVGRGKESPTSGIKVDDEIDDNAPLSYEKRRNRFLRVGRMENPDDRDKQEEKRRSRFLRVGRMKGENVENEATSKEKRRSRFLRVGRKNDESENEGNNSGKMTSADKRRSRFLRVGRGNDIGNLFDGKVTENDEKRRSRFLRVGRGDSLHMSPEFEKRRSRFLRVGRQPGGSIMDLEEKRRSRFLRVGKATDSDSLNENPEQSRRRFAYVKSDENAIEKRRSRFLRVGKATDSDSLNENPEQSSRRFAYVKSDENAIEKRRSRFLRVGKATGSDLLNENPEQSRHRFAYVKSDENAIEKRRSRFLRVGRGEIANDSHRKQLSSRDQAITHYNAKEIDGGVKKGDMKNMTASKTLEIQNKMARLTSSMAENTDNVAARYTKA